MSGLSAQGTLTLPATEDLDSGGNRAKSSDIAAAWQRIGELVTVNRPRCDARRANSICGATLTTQFSWLFQTISIVQALPVRSFSASASLATPIKSQFFFAAEVSSVRSNHQTTASSSKFCAQAKYSATRGAVVQSSNRVIDPKCCATVSLEALSPPWIKVTSLGGKNTGANPLNSPSSFDSCSLAAPGSSPFRPSDDRRSQQQFDCPRNTSW